jgi:NAD(P)H-dependent FMN reductase
VETPEGRRRLLVVHHSPTPALRALADAVLAGARDDEIEGVDVVERAALEATAADVLAADAVLLGTSANFGYMSGALKHFLDTVFLEVGGSLSDDGAAGGPPATSTRVLWGLWVHGRYDVTGAVLSVTSIVQALPWTRSAPVLEVLGDVDDADLAAARDLGGTLAALLAD